MKEFSKTYVMGLFARRSSAFQRVAPLFGSLAFGLWLQPSQATAEIQVLNWYRMGDGEAEPAPGRGFLLNDETGNLNMKAGADCGLSPAISTEAAARTGSTRALSLRNANSTAYGSSLPGATYNFGFETWIALDGNSGQHRVLYNGKPGTDGWGIEQAGNFLFVRVGSALSPGIWVDTGAWNHLAVIMDRGRISVYLNGELAGTMPGAVVLPATGELRIGDAARGFSGRLDELRTFTFAAGAFRFGDLLRGSFPVTLGTGKISSLPYGGSVDFGSGKLGQPVYPRTFRLRNLDRAVLPLASVSVTGGDAGDFRLGGWDGSPLASGYPDSGGLPLTVIFTPSAGGIRSTTLRIVSAVPGQGEFSVRLTGTGLLLPTLGFYSGSSVAPDAPLDPVSGVQIFPLVAVSQTRSWKTYTIRNSGSADLTDLALSFSGPDAADFSVGALPASLAPGASASFDVSFAPGAGGLRHAQMTLHSNDPYQGPLSYDLQGKGQGPEIDITKVAGERLAAGALLELDPADPNAQSPMPEDLNGIAAMATGDSFSLAVRRDGTVLAWGRNNSGQTHVPAGLSGVVAVAAATDSSLALKSDGTVVQWGGGFSFAPAVPPAGLSGVRALAAGGSYAAALKDDGTVVCWQWDDNGFKAPPAGLSGVAAVAVGRNHALALKSDGTVAGWGDNSWGQSVTPDGLAGVVAIAAGGYHSLALKSDGTLVQWGECGFTVPLAVSGPVAQIAANYAGYLALMQDGRLLSWSGDGVVTEIDTGRAVVNRLAAGDTGNLVRVDYLADFGVRDLAAPALRQTFTIRNAGNLPLTLSGLAISGDDAADFTLETRGTLMTLPGTRGVTTFTISFKPAAAGEHHATLRVLNNDEDESVYDIPLTGGGAVVAGPLDAWRLLHFNTTADAGKAADLADPNHNGITNLLEYALGGDPQATGGGLEILPKYAVNPVTRRPSLTVTRFPGRKGIVMTVQAADDLAGPWQDLATSTDSAAFTVVTQRTRIIELGTGSPVSVTVSDPAQIGDNFRTHRFMRLRVTRP